MKPARAQRTLTPTVVVLLVLTAAIAAVAGWMIGRRGAAPVAPSAETTARVWYCVMHPSVRQPRPGKCPICFMDLVPLEESSDRFRSCRTGRATFSFPSLDDELAAELDGFLRRLYEPYREHHAGSSAT